MQQLEQRAPRLNMQDLATALYAGMQDCGLNASGHLA